MTDAQQLLTLFGGTVLLLILVGSAAVIIQEVRIRFGGSQNFSHASASGSLRIKMSRHMKRGTILLLNAGNGLYKQQLTAKRAQRWVDGIRGWLAKGVEVHVIISLPSADAIALWQRFKTDYPKTFHLHLLDRSAATEDVAQKIASLDFFHPTLALRKGKVVGAWIEHYHPHTSAIAYDVRYYDLEQSETPDKINRYRDALLDLIEVDGSMQEHDATDGKQGLAA